MRSEQTQKKRDYSIYDKRKMRRYGEKIRLLFKQNKALKKQVKRLQRINARIRHDVSDLVYEICPTCNTEVAIRWDVKKDGYKVFCPECGSPLMLCSKCDAGIDNCGICEFGYSEEECLQDMEARR